MKESVKFIFRFCLNTWYKRIEEFVGFMAALMYEIL